VADATGREPGQVDVLLFASARELAGASRARFTAAGQTVAELRQELVLAYGAGFGRLLGACALWVNGGPAVPGQVLEAGDEVAVIPPVSGG
jgi:molybdopterin converting factor small subunit